MKFSIGDAVSVDTTGNPLLYTPRFDITTPAVTVAEYADMAGRERLLGKTFGSTQWLWAATDDVYFDRDSRELVGISFFVPALFAPAQARSLPTAPPPHPAGLRADVAQSFELPQATAFHCDPEATELRCVQDPASLEAMPDARIGIAQDLALLVRDGRVIGWSLTDPARYVTSGFAEPDPAPPSPATRLRLAECLALVSEPLVDEVMDRDPDAWRSLRETESALREQREDRRRAEVLHEVVSRLIEDYES
ncbi:hypothetical protein [Streptomyces sp. TRM49041]|uniref:hypothetical protein n=1 Tax=Streptomyces sp. TRM49041 TaxID=2603216 RepID=UPI0011EE910F|nr:hypothetical protein [Streptomyces sp. TRM49041]